MTEIDKFEWAYARYFKYYLLAQNVLENGRYDTGLGKALHWYPGMRVRFIAYQRKAACALLLLKWRRKRLVDKLNS